ncbi:MAG: Uma2 family endonuclease [Planctomycetes bacterium]|nr:Uma2 family endonuclease [Planctomycetota bacterium]MBL7042278.1 Uma2 family endonuclease [Pirellulaceae bacterium]
MCSARMSTAFELQTGDRVTREEFHRLYEQTPEGFRAELIGGVVYVASPLKLAHGKNHLSLGSLLAAYQGSSPGVQCGANTTILLGNEGEPQPDLFLRILPEYGGQSRTTEDDYVLGAPELIAEIALSSRSIDLHAKRDDYARYGVCEYLVLCLRERELRWFDLRNDRELEPGDDRIYRIGVFPGLWIDGAALLARDHSRLMAVLQEGLSSTEHEEFVRGLAANRQ